MTNIVSAGTLAFARRSIYSRRQVDKGGTRHEVLIARLTADSAVGVDAHTRYGRLRRKRVSTPNVHVPDQSTYTALPV